MNGAVFAPEGHLSRPRTVWLKRRKTRRRSERVLLLGEDLAMEYHDTAFVRTVREARLPTTCGRSGHHPRLGFAPRFARPEPKPRPADGVAGVRWLSRSWPPSPTTRPTVSGPVKAGFSRRWLARMAARRLLTELISLTGYEPKLLTFGELNDSSVHFSFMIPSTDQDVDDVTLRDAHSGTPRTSRLLRTRRHVSQSVSRRRL